MRGALRVPGFVLVISNPVSSIMGFPITGQVCMFLSSSLSIFSCVICIALQSGVARLLRGLLLLGVPDGIHLAEAQGPSSFVVAQLQVC